ncbi:MAG TPA: M23/M56 family metallopeptidase [Bacillota bacterium]|nr:M23/M56 family metallopeptidase [Bacillota bacterium]
MMMEILAFLNDFNQIALNCFIPLVDGTIKGAAILAILFLFFKLKRRIRPQTRHFILFIGMISILLIPLITQGIAFLSGLQPGNSITMGNPISHISASPANLQLITSLEPLIELSPKISNTSGFGLQLPHWSIWFLLLWVIGLLITSGKWLAENISIYRQSRAASPTHEPDWTILLNDLKSEAGVTLLVSLKFSPTVPFPLVFGWLRPVILLPESATNWPSDQRRAILLHELSHIRRYDNLSQTLATVTAIVFWFNPLVWVALRDLKTNREFACDDRVLKAGVLPSVYASHLLAIIQSLRAASRKFKSAAMAAPMATPNFEQRMVNILTKHDTNRKSLTKYNLIGLVLTALLIVATCSLGSVIGFAADNGIAAPDADNNLNFIENPQISIEGDQLELALSGTVLKGSVLDFPTLWPEQGVKNQINAPFGVRFHPYLKKNKFHSAIDIGSSKGTPIVATADGEVMMAEWNGGYGVYIEINHKYLTSTYSHLSRILVHSGDKVRRGDLIAYSGETGVATGPHLHYEIRYGQTFVNPAVLAGISQ